MNMGLGVFQATDGKWTIAITVIDGAFNVQFSITNEDNYEHDIDELIAGLKSIKGDMRQAISGLIQVKEVPDGLRSNPAQGRIVNGSRSKSKQGSRPSSR